MEGRRRRGRSGSDWSGSGLGLQLGSSEGHAVCSRGMRMVMHFLGVGRALELIGVCPGVLTLLNESPTERLCSQGGDSDTEE